MNRAEQRLDPEPIAGEEHPVPGTVQDGKGEHAAQAGGHGRTLLLVEVHQHLGVGAAAEGVAPAPKLRSQLRMVIDLAVENDLDAAILVRHRLRTGRRQVQQGEPAMNQLAPGIGIVAAAVGAAMSQQDIYP
jgi:hypothetical protein